MSDLDFLEKSLIRSGYRARYTSPDSVISIFESNFSLVSSTSASVDRCSFASDGLDHDSLASNLSLHFAGDDEVEATFSGPDPDPNKAMTVQKHSCFSIKGEKVKVHIENENQFIDSASSFSLAIKECHDRKIRSNALLKNNVSASSPRLGNMKKITVPIRKSGEFTSPGTAGMQKGVSSERVPLHSNGGRRQGKAAVGVLPFNNGKALPSKWEDAERWIFSPVSGDVGVRQSVMPHHRRPKSKSGPLGPSRIAYNSLYSPTMHMFDGGHTENFMAVSPFSAGVIATNDLMTIHSRAGGFSVLTEPCMARSVSMHGCSEVGNPPLLPLQDEKHDAIKDEVSDISHSASRRDVATQMSPESSTHSSPSTPSALRIMELQSFHSSKAEVRDVQVDGRVTMTRWSKKHRTRNTGKGTEIVDDWRKREVDIPTSSWDVTDTAKHISKVKREEAKITAWENLQKAKAEAAMRKLEMKLEKKRSSSMDKIMNKLRSAQKRAQEMRSSILAHQTHQVTRSPLKAISFHRTRQMGSLSGCFTCHAF